MEVDWGYDGLIIDTEHSTFDAPYLREALMAFRGTDCVPIVRVGANDMYAIKQALDLGAMGILVPQIETVEEAQAAVKFCRYPPQGTRGFSPRRASNYFRDIKPYLAEANESILLLVQIECLAAYHQLDAILHVPGIDCLFIGQADLAASMGHLGNPAHPEVLAVVEDIIRRCRAGGRAVAVAAVADAQAIKHFWTVGANVISAGGDTGFMATGFKSFTSSITAAGLPFSFS
jgi:2-keto-3-deoxy-L-rhamnonate aldolase RhmA